MEIARRWEKPSLNSSLTFEGHFSAQAPQATHLAGSTYDGLRRTETVKFPGSPLMPVIREWGMISMFKCLPHSTSLGERMHMEQSFVGNVLSSCAMCPPMLEHLGIQSLRLMTNNPRKVKALEGFGLRVAERKPLQVGHNPHNRKYLATKAGKLGHMLGQVHQGEEGAA